MAFNFATYDFNAVRSSAQLSRDLEAVRREFTAKEELYASRRRDLESSVRQARAVLNNDGGLRKIQREALQLRELFDALKAKHFYIYCAVPYDKKAEEEKQGIATQVYRQLVKDAVDAKDFAEQVKGFDEDDSAKKRVAELEAKRLLAFNLENQAECKIKAVDAWHTRFGAAERVVAAYKNKQRLRVNGGEEAIEAARAEFDEALALWKVASAEYRTVLGEIDQCRFPVHGASAEQRVVQGYYFQEKLRKYGRDAALAYGATLGVDVKHHLDAQLKAPRTLEELFPAEARQSVPHAQPTNNTGTVAEQLSSLSVRSSSSASSWDRLRADTSSVASLERTASANRSGASHDATGTTIGSWFMAEQPSGNRSSRSNSRSSASVNSSAARRYAATDSESDDSDATLPGHTFDAERTFDPERTSTPIRQGDASMASLSFLPGPEEFGDMSYPSLASSLPRSSRAVQSTSEIGDIRLRRQGSSVVAAGSLKAAQRSVRSAQGRFGYISVSERSGPAAHASVRSAPAQYIGAGGSQSQHSSLSSAQSSRAANFAYIPEAPVDAEQHDDFIEVVDWENCTAWFGPLRRGLGNAQFLTLVRNGRFGHSFGASAVKCSVANSNPNRIVSSRRTELDEPYATVTFATHAEAALCIRLVEDSPGDFGVTSMGDNAVPRKLDAEWCLNEHLNGKHRAPRRYIPRS